MRATARLFPLALTALAFANPASADTVYVYEPTAYYLPTRYVATESYVPTSYVLSSSAYVVPTTYVAPTSYVVRRYQPTVTYRPTTYYLSTGLDVPLVTTRASSACCDPAPPACETASGAVVERPLPPPVSGSPRSSGGVSNPDATSGGTPLLDPGVLNSTPRNGGATDTEKPLVPEPTDTGVPPVSSRDALKPPVSARGALQGKVLSAATGKPEKGVEVTFANAVGRFRDRNATTDDQGRFSVVLPEGDWTVKVARDSGGTIDRDLTVAGGLVTDEKDRPVAALTINR